MVTQGTSDAAAKVAAFKAKKAGTTAPITTPTQATAPHAAAVPNISGNQQIPYNMPSEPAPKITPVKPTTPTQATAPSSNSIVDYLGSLGQDSSYANRTTLAKKYGIGNYAGTAAQNTALLNAMKGGQQGVPTAPTPTAPTAPTAPVKPTTTPNNQIDTPARLQEIQNKLSGYTTSRPELFTDRNAFNSFFKYTERSPAQAKVLDEFFTNQEAKQNEISAKADAIRLNALNTKFGPSLATISNVDATFLMNNNPEKYKEYLVAKAQASALDIINGTNTITSTTFPDTTPETAFEQLMKSWGVVLTPKATVDMSETYHQAVTVGLQPYIDTLQAAKTKVEAFKKSYDNTLADVKKEYAGTGVTEAFIRAMAAKKADEQLSEYQQAQNDYNDALTAYNTQVGIVDKEFDLEYKDQSLAITATQAQVENFKTMYGLYQETPAGMAETAAATYAANYPSMDTGTTLQKQQALNQALKPYYDTYQPIINRPQAQVVSEILAYAKKNGISVSQAFKENFLKPLQAKPYYKALLAKAIGTEAASSINQDVKKVGDFYFKQDENGDWQPYNPGVSSNITGITPSGTYVSVKVGTGTIKLDSVASSSFETALSEMTKAGIAVTGVNGLRTQAQQDELYGYGRTAAQCVAAGVDAKYAKPNEKERTRTTNSSHLVGLAVDVYGAGGAKPNEKQIAIMNNNGWFQPEATLAKGDYGHFEYSGVGASGAGYDKNLGPTYSKFLTNKSALTAADWEQLNKAGIDLKSLGAQANAWKMAESPEAYKSKEIYSTTIELINQMRDIKTGELENKNYTGVGPKLMDKTRLGFLSDTDRNLFNARFDKLMSLLTTDQLVNLRGLGAMSDKEFAVMQTAATSLNLGLDESVFINILDSMKKAKEASPYYSKWNLEDTVVLPG